MAMAARGGGAEAGLQERRWPCQRPLTGLGLGERALFVTTVELS